jgi:hypothetical protein
MNQKDLKRTLKHFTSYSKDDENSCEHYFHNSEAFNLIIFNGNEVYQESTDHEAMGIELVNLRYFKMRFKSFTGTDFDI